MKTINRSVDHAIRLLVLLAFVFSSFLQPGAQPARADYDPTYTWVADRTLDTAMITPAHFDLELDSSGYPHVAYFKDGTNEDTLVYRYFDGTQWQTGYSAAAIGGYDYVSLELDAGGNPHMVYYRNNSLMAFYLYFDGASWTEMPVTPMQQAGGQYATLELTDGGVPVVAFYYPAQSSLSVATRVGDAFVLSPVETAAVSTDAFSYISMELDQNDHPHLAYCVGASLGECDELHAAVYDGSDWIVEIVDEAQGGYGAGYHTSLVLDENGNEHLSYSIKDTHLMYAVHTESGWDRQQVISGESDQYTAIGLDSIGRPVIGYYESSSQYLKVIYWDGSTWSMDMNPDWYMLGMYLNLEMDASGSPTLAFWDSYNHLVTLAEYQPQPDLAVTQFWVDEADQNLRVSIRNDGLGAYEADLEVELYVNNEYTDMIGDTPRILPGELYNAYLQEPACPGTEPTMQVKVCLVPYMDDLDGNNNCLEETWVCDPSPLIISNFAITNVTQDGFTATWTTNRPADTVLMYTRADGRGGSHVSDPTLVENHQVVITGLEAHKTYRLRGYSTDAGGILASSPWKALKTLGFDGDIPIPEITYERRNTREEVYQLRAAYSDTSNIQRVEFWLDEDDFDVLVGTDYSPNGGVYEMPLAPARHGYTRDTFYTQRDLVAQAYNFIGQPFANPELFEPFRESAPIESTWIAPAPDSTIYVNGSTVPPGTQQEIQVSARQFEWECDYSGGGMPDCGDVAQPVELVRFYADGTLLGTDTTPDDDVYTYTWDLSGKPLGNYHLEAVVYATDGGSQAHDAYIHIVAGQPDIVLSRSVSHYSGESYFRVRLTVENDEDATAPVEITQIKENFKGFQPVNLALLDPVFGQWSLAASSGLQGKQGIATITLDQPYTLNPGESMEFNYYVVPILFPDMSTAEYKLGMPQSKIFYLDGEGNTRTKSISNPSPMVWDSGSTQITESVARAFRSSDYLIITAPSRLTELYNINHVHKLMGDMAWLAMLKQGVLGYWDPSLDKNVLNTFLQDNEEWANRMHPNFEDQYGGYVLLVGESEVIPGYQTGPYELYWEGTDGGANYYVQYSDNPYAHTGDGNGAPDLMLGRIIGNSAWKLDQAILNSIDAHFYQSYEREDAYVGSGTGNCEDTMQDDADSVTGTLTSFGYTVSKHHWENEAFLYIMENMDFTEYDGLAHGDVDGDGTEEIIWADDSTNKAYFVKPIEGVYAFAFNLDFEDGDSLAAGDVDDDGQVEIIIGDRGDIIRTHELNGAASAWFERDFVAWEQIAVGDVWSENPGDEIVMADINGNSENDDFLRVYTHQGNLLRSINLDTLGYDFMDHDILQIGDLNTYNLEGAEEIVFTDRNNDKIVIVHANGFVDREINLDFDRGDNMVVANVDPAGSDEIVVADRSNSIRTYTFTSGDDPAHSTYVDVEEYDGLVIMDVAGSDFDHVIHADRGDRFRVVDMNYPDYAVQQFEDNIAGADLIWFEAHGWAGGMSPAIDVGNFPVDFDGAHPIVNAWSCTTGNYEGNNDNGIAEAFLQSGAGVYIGSTEVSPVSKNSNMSRKYLRDYWTVGNDFAESYARFKSARWNVSEYYDWWWYVVNEYNIYGDPKFDIMDNTTLRMQAEALPLAPEETLTIQLPMYTVEEVNGVHYVEIPPDAILGTHGGDLFQDQGEYEVPLYVHTVEIPAGQQVQNVTLTSMSNLYAENGLNLPLVAMVPASSTTPPPVRSALTRQTISSVPGHDWSPNFEEPFTWTVNDKVEGGSTLTLTLHPFYYDPAALYSEYYQEFAFTIETIPTTVTIREAGLDRDVYHAGEDVILNLEVENTGAPLNAYLSAVIRKAGSGEAVDGFDLASLDNLSGTAYVDLTWNWSDSVAVPPGGYVVEIIVQNIGGDYTPQRLAERTLEFVLGGTAGEVTEFSVSPHIFQPGDGVDAVLSFSNTGDLPLGGQLVVQVQTMTGDLVETFTQDFADLPDGASATAVFTWDSTGATEPDYRIIGYVSYASGITPVFVEEIHTQARIYLPSVLR